MCFSFVLCFMWSVGIVFSIVQLARLVLSTHVCKSSRQIDRGDHFYLQFLPAKYVCPSTNDIAKKITLNQP